MPCWQRFPRLVLGILLATIAALPHAAASNWAQVSGDRRQNVAKPRETAWTPRYGMAVVGTDYFEAPEAPSTGWQSSVDDPDELPFPEYEIFMLGGDDYDEEMHTGGYLNEVWSTSGAAWSTVEDKVRKEPRIVSKMQWTERGPLQDEKLPPSGVTYDEWLECLVTNWPNVGTIASSCDPDPVFTTGSYRRWSPRRNLAATYFKPGPNANSNVQYRTKKLDIWVLGGRARAIEDIPVRESWGGVIPWGPDDMMKDKFDNPPRAYPTGPSSVGDPKDPFKGGAPFPDSSGSRNRICKTTEKVNDVTGEVVQIHSPCWREKTVLKNDVWAAPKSVQGEWTLVNPGCKYHEDGSLLMPGEPGVEGGKCLTGMDCYGNSVCIDTVTELEVVDGDEGRCKCQMWLPRERHAVAVLNPNGEYAVPARDPTIYVSGGIMRIQEQLCGEMMCGGGYRMWANDVWSTLDGVTWTEIAKPSYAERGGKFGERWNPRAGHAMLVMGGKLFIIGGEGGDLNEKSERPMYLGSDPLNDLDPLKTSEIVLVRNVSESPLYADVWSSSDGSSWTLNGTAAWAPRKDFVAGIGCKRRIWPPTGGLPTCQGPRIFVSGGETADGIVGDTWRSDGGVWHRDFDNSATDFDQRIISDYVDLDGPVRQLQTLSDANIRLLQSEGIVTVRDFAVADADAIGKLRGPRGDRTGWGDVCRHKRRAEALVNKCTVKTEYYPGYFSRPEHAEFASPADDDPESEVDTSTHPYPDLEQEESEEEEDDPYDEDGLDGYGDDGCEQATDPAFVLDDLHDWMWHKNDAERGELKYYLAPNRTSRNEFGNPVPTVPDTLTRLGLQCRWVPTNRTMAAGLVFRNKFYVFGGRQAKGIEVPNFKPRTYIRTGSTGVSVPGDDITELPVGMSGPHQGSERGKVYEPGILLNDGWYRDDTLPKAKIVTKPQPPTGSEQVVFKFASYDGPQYPQVPSETSIYEFVIYHADQCCEGSVGDVETRSGEEDYDPRLECYDTAEVPICKGPESRVFLNPSAFGGIGDHAILWPWTWTKDTVVISERKQAVYPYNYRVGPDEYITVDGLRGACNGRSGLPNDDNYCFSTSNTRASILVRAMDPAGNFDVTFAEGGNQYTWTYVHPLPIAEIIGIVLGFIVVLLVLYLQIRRRRRKKAMERYAMKRMRRKFKGMQKDAAKK